MGISHRSRLKRLALRGELTAKRYEEECLRIAIPTRRRARSLAKEIAQSRHCISVCVHAARKGVEEILL